jgi:hypothetical protein
MATITGGNLHQHSDHAARLFGTITTGSLLFLAHDTNTIRDPHHGPMVQRYSPVQVFLQPARGFLLKRKSPVASRAFERQWGLAAPNGKGILPKQRIVVCRTIPTMGDDNARTMHRQGGTECQNG